jgi:anaerobic selenocysteine-containing dehydrogenase
MNQPVPRRAFLVLLAATGSALVTGAQAQAVLDEKDAQAVSLGYVVDATRANAKKYAKYAPGQKCASCALYQGKVGDKSGPCPIYGGKLVSPSGWCSAWSKKA